MSEFERRASAGYLTNWAARLFARAIDRRLAALGVSSGQLPVFFALGRGEALTQADLARAAAIEQPTMAATLNRMERDGLIARTPDPADRRRVLITLTPKALGLAPQVLGAVEAVNAKALADMGPQAQDGYVAALQLVIQALERED
jgi:DNA-binding MarR family transcriptional regulator